MTKAGRSKETRKGNMLTGIVKWFDEKKGYGFITRDDGQDDVFVHHTELEGKGFRKVSEGERVEFDITPGKKGPKAARVRVLAMTNENDECSQ